MKIVSEIHASQLAQELHPLNNRVNFDGFLWESEETLALSLPPLHESVIDQLTEMIS